MSTKTTFKRIALVAVAALGLGVLSVAPSQAALTDGTLAFTATSGTSKAGLSDTTTAAVISVEGLLSNVSDTITVKFISKGSRPTAASGYVSSHAAKIGILDTATANSGSTVKVGELRTAASFAAGNDSFTGKYVAATNEVESSTAGVFAVRATSVGYVGARFWVQLDSISAPMYGAYGYTALVSVYSQTPAGTVTITEYAKDFSITVAQPAAVAALAGGTIDPSKTTAVLNAGEPTTLSAVDSSVAVVSTAAVTNHATIQVKTYTSASLAAPESITVTLTGAGQVCNADGTVCGNNLTVAGDGDDLFRVRANGTAGTASIVVATTTKTFPAKTVTFYAKSPATITVSTNKPVIAVAAASAQTDVIRAVAKDANGNVWGGQLYSFASTAADALIASSATTPVACSFNSTYGYHECSVKGTAKGTANIKVMDASLDTDATIATTDAAVTSAAASVRVSTGSATSAKLAFDKATYAPGEKAQIWVQVLDAEGLALPTSTITAAFAADVVSTVAFSTGGTGLSGSANPVIAAATDATVPTVAGYAVYTVYMPYSSGDVTISATGSTGLAASGRVAVSATASVVNTSVDAATDAALAAADAADAATAAAQDASDAVAALSATVAKLVASLKAQITSLTNLVIKIQKKVKA